MLTVKISKALAKDYERRQALGERPGYGTKEDTLDGYFPTSEGEWNLTSEWAEAMLKDALAMGGADGTKPSMAMAYTSLAARLKKQLDELDMKAREIIEKQDGVSQRNSQFIELDRSEILTLDNVRTVFDDESLAELAEDIKNNGLINPITVRHGHDGKYFLVAGERRMKACELAGVPIMAKVINADAAAGKRIQLAENIHREDLCLEDKARAVRELYDQLGTMQAVADLVKKSKAWVSKHVAVTEPDFGWRARRLLEEGTCEDLELLGTLSKIERSCTWSDAEEAIKRFEEGDLNREEAREFLRSRSEAKSKRDQEREAEDKRRQAEWKARQEARAAEEEQGSQAPAIPEREYLSPQKALLNLVKFYVLFRDQEHQGETIRVATEISTVPYAGEGVGEAFQAFTDEEIKQAWRDALDAVWDWGEDAMTEEYFKDMAGIKD